MPVSNLAPKIAVAAVFVASAVYVHLRGRVRHKFTRQLTDHSTFLAPYNALLYLSSAVPAKPYLDVSGFPELKPLQDNWQTIRDEGLKLFDEGYIRAAAKYNDLGFNSFFRTGWKRFYLKWYDTFLPSAQALCPKTVALVQSIPSVHGAMFAVLPPGGRLVRHRDPFAGSLRYHLGLDTPNSPDCYIAVDGEPYYWKDGEGVVFDETYIHYAENKTDKTRLILFCDVERPLRSRLVRRINHFVMDHVVKATATQNVENEKVGALNHVFSVAYRVRLLGKRIKAYNQPLYYAIKYALLGALLYAIFA
ncbi:MAG TPA: aspartyl/asparaginyl beta-hydroxylase domain-containing protein [Burkholderiales bacterium]|nr:aspartyl/asparaginyl beta-hydroxylase domain-containing protein [Burkholderiales bacterium]